MLLSLSLGDAKADVLLAMMIGALLVCCIFGLGWKISELVQNVKEKDKAEDKSYQEY